RVAPDGAVRRRTPQSVAHAAEQGRGGEQGLPRAEGAAGEARQGRIAARRSPGEDAGDVRRGSGEARLRCGAPQRRSVAAGQTLLNIEENVRAKKVRRQSRCPPTNLPLMDLLKGGSSGLLVRPPPQGASSTAGNVQGRMTRPVRSRAVKVRPVPESGRC